MSNERNRAVVKDETATRVFTALIQEIVFDTNVSLDIKIDSLKKAAKASVEIAEAFTNELL